MPRTQNGLLVLIGCAVIVVLLSGSQASAAPCNVTDFTSVPEIPNPNYYTPRPYSLSPESGGLWDCFARCGTGNEIQVIDDPAGGGNQVCRITAGSGLGYDVLARRSITPCVACGDGTFTISLRVKSGGSGSGNSWRVSFGTGSQTHARLQGTATSFFGRAGGARVTPTFNLTGSGTFDAVIMHVDTVTRLTEYYVNGTLLGVLNHDVDGTGGQKIDRFDIERIENAGASGVVYLDDVTIEPCRNCHTNVTPKLAKDTTNIGGPFIPSTIVYTIQNYGSTSANYTAQEVTANGTPFDYPWMAITSGPSGGLPGNGSSANVVIGNFSTAGASPGLNVGYIKFTDTCGGMLSSYLRQVNLWNGVPIACFAENYDALNTANLEGQNGWSGGMTGGLSVVAPGNGGGGKAAQLTLGSLTGSAETRTFSCPSCADSGIITATVKVKGNAANTGGGSNAWRFWVTASNGVDYGRWQGTAGNSVIGRIGGTSATTPGSVISTSAFTELKMVIDTINYTTEFLVDNVSKGKFSNNIEHVGQNTPTNIGGSVTIERINRSDVSGTITFDDISVLTCPTCGIRVYPDPSGGSQAGRQNYNNFSSAVVGDPNPALSSPMDWDFFIANAGSTSLNFTVTESDINGNPFNYSWIDLDYTGRPLALEQIEKDTAHLNITGLVPGEYIGFLKFADNCSGNTYTLRELKLIVIENTDQHTCLIDSFSLPNNNLDTHVGWSGTASVSTSLLNGAVKVITNPTDTAGTDLVAHTDVPDACVTTCANLNSVISAKLKVQAGTGSGIVLKVPLLDDAGNQLGMFQLSPTTVVGRIGNTVTGAGTLTGTSTFDTIEAQINTSETLTVGGIPPNSTRFLLNGIALPQDGSTTFNPISHAGATNILAQVEIDRVNSLPPDGRYVILDDLNVTYCVSTCNDPVFDVRNTNGDALPDGLVEDHDLTAFEVCTGTQIGNSHGHTPTLVPNPNLGIFECKCMDLNHDQKIDIDDFAVFQRCYTGLNGGPVNPNCDN